MKSGKSRINLVKKKPFDKDTSEVKCPICKGPLTEISDYKVGFVCPRCGFKKVK